MLRPDMVIDYAKQRGEKKLSDFHQLMDGINLSGRIIVGGSTQQSMRYQSILAQHKRLGIVMAVNDYKDRKLDPFITYTFDTFAIAQLLMIAKNEAFHGTIDTAIGLIQKVCVEDGQPVEIGLQVLREKADEIGHL